MNSPDRSPSQPTAPVDADHEVELEIEFYWRPGCGFCMSLDRQLAKHDIAVTKRNIWDNPADADFVRSVANGNETVPTVRVGGTALVNPTLDQVVTVLSDQAPHLVPEGYEPGRRGLMGRSLGRLLGGD